MRILVTGGSGFIGTNLIKRLLERGDVCLDLSLTEPLNPQYRSIWKQIDLLDGESFRSAFAEFSPEIVIHLAARTDCDENTTVERGYRVNTDGTMNVLNAIKACPSVTRALITSSQFVCGPSRMPQHDEDYFPHTVYGHSKVITEQLTRQADLTCNWTLIRPTNIWGPWHMRYAQEFWKIAAKGLYLHPAGKPVIRCYGYVETIIDQMLDILALPSEKVNKQTFYVSDPPDDIYKWANAFCLALCGRPARRVPRSILRLAGLAGDFITTLSGKKFYITSSRYQSMISDYVTPMEKTFDLLGKPTRKLEEGVQESVKWLHDYWKTMKQPPL